MLISFQCQDIIAQPEFFRKRKNIDWPVDEFPILAGKLWTSILKNEKLDMPSHWVHISIGYCSNLRCGNIIWSKLNHCIPMFVGNDISTTL
jgi:hypothetical protein